MFNSHLTQLRTGAAGLLLSSLLGLSQSAAAAELKGTVVDRATNQPVVGAQISVIKEKGRNPEIRYTADSGADGQYRIEGVTPGKYAVTARSAGHRPGAQQPVQIDASTATVDFQLDPAS